MDKSWRNFNGTCIEIIAIFGYNQPKFIRQIYDKDFDD